MNIKNYIWFFSIIVCVVLNTVLVEAEFYNVSHQCSENVCVEGQPIEWFVEVDNRGQTKIEYISIELRDSENDNIVAIFNASYYPLSNFRGDLFEVPAFGKNTIILNAVVPKANDFSFFNYYLCFDTAVTDPYIVRDNIYNLRRCYEDRVERIVVVECVADSSCNTDELCSFNKCLKVKCDECQFALNHKCNNYECCSSSACKDWESCEENKCIDLGCDYNEFAFNHSCAALNCSFNEEYIDNSCRELDCSENEFVFNHSCEKLNCSNEEFIFNHTCTILNCSFDEEIVNQSCSKLNCKYNETMIDHSCQALECYFFQKIINHQCVNDKPVVFKLGIELIVVLIIIGLLILDIRRYKSKKK